MNRPDVKARVSLDHAAQVYRILRGEVPLDPLIARVVTAQWPKPFEHESFAFWLDRSGVKTYDSGDVRRVTA